MAVTADRQHVFGYQTGSGGAVAQGTSKATTVVLNKPCGTIALVNSALAAGAIVTFQLTNSFIGANDIIVAQHDSIGTFGAYTITPNTPAAGSCKFSIRNNSAGSLSEAIVIRFAIVKGVIA
jgi:hypothetical protein